MKRRIRLDGLRATRNGLMTLVVPVLFVLAACGSPSGETSPSPDSVASTTQDSTGGVLPKGTAYTVTGYSFTPLTVTPGQEVEVIDQDAEAHTLTAVDGSFDTGNFDSSSPGRFVAPEQPGTYEFVCEIHPSMTGTQKLTLNVN